MRNIVQLTHIVKINFFVCFGWWYRELMLDTGDGLSKWANLCRFLYNCNHNVTIWMHQSIQSMCTSAPNQPGEQKSLQHKNLLQSKRRKFSQKTFALHYSNVFMAALIKFICGLLVHENIIKSFSVNWHTAYT